MAKARDGDKIRLLGVTGRKRRDLLIGTALQATTLLVLALPAAAQPAPNARPSGGTVVAGGAAISQTAGTTTIDQSSQRAAINWQSFSVGSNQNVTFTQPSSSAVALNRVTGPDPSQIAGRIDANGQIVLVNQAGVTFYKGAQVNAQSLIVTSANVSNANFMAGNMAFNQAGNANASVSNQGTITVKQAGLAALVAPNVANSGVINARLGHVVLAGAKTATLDLYGDGLLSLDVGNQVTKAPVGPGGKTVTALVTNSGTISADGGTVQLTAAAADGVLQKLVQAGGTISANSAGAATGTVSIAGIGGSVNVTGLVSAAGTAAGTTGGQVAVNATGAVTLTSSARIDASGAAGGGTVAIGTTLARAIGGPGTPASMTASNVHIRRGATIDASATHAGNGGRVTVLSANTTRMNGTIAATGGTKSGNGGFVEVSGNDLALNGSIDVGAPAGIVGTILLDPTFLAIIASGGPPGSAIDGEFVSGTLAASAPDGSPLPSTVLASTIESMESSGNVVIQATKTIDVQAPLAIGNGLTLQAGGDLTVEAAGSISAGGNILLQAGTATATPNGAILLNGDVTSTQGSVQLIAGTGGITLNANVTGLNVDLNATGGGVTQATGAIVTATTLFSSLGVTGHVVMLGGNAVQNLGNFAVTQSGPALFQMVDTSPLSVTGQVSAPAGQIYLRDTDVAGIQVASAATVTTGATGLVSFQANAFSIASSVAHGTITTGTFELGPTNPKSTVTLGLNASTGLILPSLVNISSSAVRIGAVTQPASLTPGATAFAIAVNGTFDVLNRALELDATKNVDGSLGPLINVGTLSGTGGTWSLPSNNTVTNTATINADSFTLNDTIGLNVAGPLNGGASATITDTGNLTVAGAVNAAAVSLTANNIDIGGLVTDGGAGTVQLIANTGTIGETGTLISGVLTGSAIGAAGLLGGGASINQVATLGSFTATSFALRDGAGLTVTGTASATSLSGQVFLESTAPTGITIAPTGSVSANTSDGMVSLQTDSLVNNAAVTAATIQLAPATSGGTVTVGSASLAGLDATNLLIGAVTQPNGGGLVTTAGSIVFATATAFTGAGSVILDASSTTAAGASGAVTQSAPLTIAGELGGTANSIDLTNGGNSIGILNGLTATSGNLSVLSGIALTSVGVSAPSGNVYLASTAAGGVTLSGPASAAGIVGIEANVLNFGVPLPAVTANTFELAPITPGATVTLGSNPGGLSLAALTNIAASTVRIGAITLPGGVAPTITAGAVTIAATFNAAATTTLQLEASGAISQSAALINVATLAATGGSVLLTNAGNQIAVSSGITATAGNVELVDGENLTLNGAYGGNDLFFEVAAADGNLTIGASGPATLTAGAGARISLIADGISANVAGSIGNAGGTVELAPFDAIGVSLGGGGGLAIDAVLLSSINVGNGTLVVGGFTNLPASGTVPVASASSVALNGAVDLTGKAGTLVLLANGPITEPGGPLTVGTVTGTSVGDFSLNNAGNQIQASTGMTAAGGNVILVDDPTLVLSGLYNGNNLFFQVTQPGGSLALGTVAAPAILNAQQGGRISLVADSMTATAASSITAPQGTVEIAPFSAINESVLGTNSSGQLVVSATLLSDITGASDILSTLVIGGYTNLAASATTPAASAGGITLDGALNLSALAGTLELLANGPVTEPGGPLTVTNLSGSSVGNFSLTNPANAIGQSIGITATNGDVVLVNGTNLALTNTQSGTNLFFEVAAPGGTLAVGGFQQPAELTAASGGRITLVADQITENNQSAVAAPAGTVELAPFSAIPTSLLGSASAGQLLIGPALLAIVTPGISTLTIGGFTNVPAAAVSSAPSASSVTIAATFNAAATRTLRLEATGAISQSAALINVATLAATGGSVILTNAGNQIVASSGITATAGNVELVDDENLTLNGAYSGNDLFFEVAAADGTLTIGASGPATLTAGAGARISLIADGISANVAGSIGNAGGTVELAPFDAIGVSLGGGGSLAIDAALLSSINVGNGTLVVGGFTNLPASGTTPTATASSVALNGAVDLTGKAGTLELLANGPITEPGGPLTVGTVTGASVGDFSLNNANNQIQASTGMTAAGGNVILVDDPTLVLSGPYNGNNLFFQVTQAGGTLALGAAAAPAILTAADGGRISLVADSMTATATSTITAPQGTVEIAPFSAINESVLGSNGSGQLLVSATLLSDITGGSDILSTLVIGGYTNLAASATTPAASAGGITLDGALNLSALAATLELLANGPVTEPDGPLTVANLSGSSIGNFSLTNPANAIGQSFGITATNGDVVLVDGTNLTLINAQSGGNLFFEVAAPGGTLAVGGFQVPAELTAASGGRITLVADRMTENGESRMTAPTGTVELAPFSTINTSLLGSSSTGQLLIDPAMLAIITPGISTLTVGGFTNVPAGAVSSAPSASSITVDGTVTLAPLATTLNLETSGAVTQSAPIVNVGTLTGTTGSTALSNAKNSVGTLGNYIANNGFALTNATNLLIAGTLAAGPGATFTVNGALTETGAIAASVLTGSAIGTASLTGNNTISELNGFTVNGNFTLNDTGNLAIDGLLSASRIVVSDPSSQITLGDGATISTGGNTRPSTPIAPASSLPQNGAPGAWLNAASFAQIGSSSVTGLGGGPSTLQISVTGNMRFDPPLGLAAPGTWLDLNLTNGIASGNVFVNALDVIYSVPGAANLFGTIDGIAGPTAARFGFIQPAQNPNYLFNNCEIAAVSCGLTISQSQSQSQTPGFPTTSETVIFVPIQALLALVTQVLVLDPEDSDNLLQLPVVSKEDY